MVHEDLAAHHARYDQDRMNRNQNFQYVLLWANRARWLRDMVAPMLEHAFSSVQKLVYIGLTQDVQEVDAPILGDVPQDVDDMTSLLFLHVRQAICAVGELVHFVSLSAAPPWCYSLLLEPATEKEGLHHMKCVWEVIKSMEESEDVLDCEF